VRLLTATAILSVALALAGCGGSSSPGVARLSSAKGASPSSSESRGSSPEEGPASLERAAVAYARCMRANGVPSFPDPNVGGGFLFQARAGLTNSPLFRAAQAKCHKLLPPGPGSGAPPSAQTLARFLKIARCMREHGVHAFPDPRTSLPSNAFPPRGGVISDIEGVILVFASTIDQRSPAFERAAAACAFPLHNH
jgi:hypothetical protein